MTKNSPVTCFICSLYALRDVRYIAGSGYVHGRCWTYFEKIERKVDALLSS